MKKTADSARQAHNADRAVLPGCSRDLESDKLNTPWLPFIGETS